jgi:hypothetical protein
MTSVTRFTRSVRVNRVGNSGVKDQKNTPHMDYKVQLIHLKFFGINNYNVKKQEKLNWKISYVLLNRTL